MKHMIIFLATLFSTTHLLAQWSTSGSNVYYNSGYVGIGTTSPLNGLHVVGGHIASAWDNSLSAFVQLWGDNAVIWKNGSVSAGLRFGSANDLEASGFSEKMRIMDAGNVGIGTSVPNALLELKKAIAGGLGAVLRLTGGGGGNAQVAIDFATYDPGGGTPGSRIIATDDGAYGASIDFQTKQTGAPGNPLQSRLTITNTGNIGIGTAAPGSFKLAVEGNLGARKMIVTQATPWPDYVFSKNYRLPSLYSVARYIRINNHLPEMPSADSVAAKGLDLGGNQALLLKKIEELTLYVIELNKKNEFLQKKVEKLDAIVHGKEKNK